MSDETKLACGCHAEWTGERWQVAASSFLCDHNQGDPVDGAVPLPGQPDLLNVAKHHAPGVVHQYLVETVAALAAAEAEVARLREAADAAMHELGVPQDHLTPAPVGNAYEILRAALSPKEDE